MVVAAVDIAPGRGVDLAADGDRATAGLVAGHHPYPPVDADRDRDIDATGPAADRDRFLPAGRVVAATCVRSLVAAGVRPDAAVLVRRPGDRFLRVQPAVRGTAGRGRLSHAAHR